MFYVTTYRILPCDDSASRGTCLGVECLSATTLTYPNCNRSISCVPLYIQLPSNYRSHSKQA